MGLECGILSISLRCNRRSSCPASNLASGEKGGVFICPSNQTSGLTAGDITKHCMSYLTCRQSLCSRRTRVSLGLSASGKLEGSRGKSCGRTRGAENERTNRGLAVKIGPQFKRFAGFRARVGGSAVIVYRSRGRELRGGRRALFVTRTRDMGVLADRAHVPGGTCTF